ncbi:MAG: ribonuclease H-like domain-containing protein [Parachlamydiaceae bacterium]|nr:ribonuclease H-like domain-containing protein [Parachlamydiaceae bacterium]
MLTKTFSHIDGITPSLEQQLWEIGIRHWDDFLNRTDQFAHLPKTKLQRIQEGIFESKQALEKNDLNYFKSVLKPKEHWRLSKMGKVAYVDIETTGLSRWSDDLTLLGIYDGSLSHMYINGKNLADAHAKLMEFDIIVTFNGKQFDMPFIEHHFSYQYDFVHLDLRYMLKELGLQGGLKNIESQLGICRDMDLQGVDGFEAVRLWRQYQRGNQAALQKLLRYNEQDIVNLKFLLNYYIDKKTELL